MAVAAGVNALLNDQVQKIVLIRPAVEAGENLGFLPGDLKDKLDPYMQPLYDALKDMIPQERLDVPEYIEVDFKKMTAKFIRIPELSDVPYPAIMEPNLVVEYYAKN